MPCRWRLSLSGMAILGIALADGKRVTISNLHPRLSTTGDIVNAHDGTVRFIDGAWWMHAAEYGECADPPHHGCEMSGPTRNTSCGFKPDHNVTIWKSPDLSSGSWERVGVAIQCTHMPNCGILYRPHLVFNPNTQLYVLFWNYVNKEGAYAGDAVATATSPAGPFTLANILVNTTYPTGDFDVFVDRDGQGYMIYSANHLMYLERLTPDYLYSTGENANIPGGFPPPSPPPIPNTNLHCPAGTHVDVVEDAGDNGSCNCDEFCASDWSGAIRTARPNWTGAASAIPGSTTNCQCVQGTKWCPKNGGTACQSTCGGDPPVPKDFCVPNSPARPATDPPVAFPVPFVEAPAMIERLGTYYALFGHCCCFCYQGSGMFVFTAPHPMGPWTQQLQSGRADFGCVANATTPTPKQIHSLPVTAFPQPGQGCIYNGAKSASVTRAQQNFVVEIKSSSSNITDYVWTGDRWMQAPDGIKGHEPQTWTRLSFDSAGHVQPLEWVDELEVMV